MIRPNDRETGRPRRFAFLTLGSREKGEEAIKSLDGSELGGRKLGVKEAEDRRPQHQHRPAYQGNRDDDSPSHEIPERPKRTDDRPRDEDGKRIVYKGI